MGVSWFEEPVSSDDLEGLRLMRDARPARHGHRRRRIRLRRRPISSECSTPAAVDVLQADATRCGGITGFLASRGRLPRRIIFRSPLIALRRCTLHVGCAAQPLRHAEYFHDHVRIEKMLFDGVPQPENGVLKPDLSRPGMGLEFKAADAKRYQL